MAQGPADGVVDVFKELVWDPLVQKAVTYIVGLVPLFAWGPLAYIISRVVVYVGNILYEGIRDFVNVELIILRNQKYHDKFVAAQFNLKMIALAKGIDSKEFQDEREKQADAFADFVLHHDAGK